MNTIEKLSLSLSALNASLAFLICLSAPAYALRVEGEAWVDLGIVHNAHVTQHVFVLYNETSKPSFITKVTPDCDLCTRIELSDDYVLPGESIKLKATLLTESLEGPILKGIHVEDDQASVHLDLGFKAQVQPRFVHASSPGLVAGLTGNKPHRCQIQLQDRLNKDWQNAKVEVDAHWLSVSQETSELQDRIQINYVADPEKLASGMHTAVISLQKGGEIIQLPIAVLVEQEVVMTPHMLTFRRATTEQRHIIHYKANKRSHYIKKIQVPQEHFKVVLKPEFTPGAYRIYVYGKQLEAYTNQDTGVRIEMMGEDREDMYIPIVVRP